MSLKERIFNFGIYGEHITTLTKDEFDMVKSEPWVEILSPSQLEEFKLNFTLSSIPSIRDRCYEKDECYIRMNIIAWRNYIFGESLRVTNKNYFLILDFLVKNPGFVSISFLRSKYNIDPKTMFYICKKLKSSSLIEESYENKEMNIKLFTRQSKPSLPSQAISTTELQIDLSGINYYNNIPLMDQIKRHICSEPNGFNTESLLETLGIGKKIGLKYIYKVCDLYPNELKLIDSIENKHTTYKVFSIENLEKRNDKKLNFIAGNINQENVDMLLTSKDRQEILKIIAEQRGHFLVSKEIINEIKNRTGYKYDIDRKNLIANAKKAGLNVFRLNIGTNSIKKYVIAQPKYDSEILKLYSSQNTVNSSKFSNKMCKYFLYIERCITEDNGYSSIPQISSKALYSHLISMSNPNDEESFEFDYDFIMRMKVESFYKIIKIRNLNFRVKCTYEILKTKKECFKNIKLSCNNLYMDGEEPRKINTDFYATEKELDNLDLKQYLDYLPAELQDILREYTKPMRFKKRLELLAGQNLIYLNITDDNRILYKLIRNSMTNEFKNKLEESISGSKTADDMNNNIQNLNYFKKELSYNQRCHFIHLMKNTCENNFLECAKEIISTHFGKCYHASLNEYCYHFMKLKPKKCTFETACISSITSDDHKKAYTHIKKLVIFTPLDILEISDFERNVVEEVLDYMAREDIVLGYKPRNKAMRISIHPRFRDFLGDTEIIQEVSSIDDIKYYNLFFNKIKNIVYDCGSVDFDELLRKIKYLEPFELSKFLELNKEYFVQKEFDGFFFISIANLCDPFEL